MPLHYPMAALFPTIYCANRLTLPVTVMSNKFALSDIFGVDSETWTSAHVSSLDSPEIGPLVELVRISLVDKALAQPLDS